MSFQAQLAAMENEMSMFAVSGHLSSFIDSSTRLFKQCFDLDRVIFNCT